MPAKSAKQERFMQAVANNPKFAKEVGVPQSVGKEFTKAGGGTVQRPQMNKEMLNRKSDMKRKMSGRSGKSAEFETEKSRKMGEDMKRRMEMRAKAGKNAPMEPTDEDMPMMKKGGMTKKYMGGGMMKGYKAGGMPMVEKDGKKVPAFAADGKGKMKEGGKVKSEMKKTAKKAVKEHESKMHKGTKKMASGGKVRGAGCAQRGVRAAKMR